MIQKGENIKLTKDEMAEEVLVLLKPDAVIRRGVGAKVIENLLKNKDLRIDYFGEVQPRREFVEEHYAQHKERFFYEWLVRYVSSSPIIVVILNGQNAINTVRTLLGSTIPEKAGNNTIRGRFGIFGGINVAHASDSHNNGHLEVNLWKKVINMQNCNYRTKATEYVKKYLDFPIVEIDKYRQISQLLTDGKINQDNAKKLIANLLREESDFDDAVIFQFSEIVVQNAVMREVESK
jgi:nucleoside-diphosphate kinase